MTNPIQQIMYTARRAEPESPDGSGERGALLPSTPTAAGRAGSPLSHGSPEPYTGARATRVWDVKMPPPKKHMVGGKLVPSVGGAFGRRLLQKARRISVEIHAGATDDAQHGTAENESVMRGLLRGDSTIRSENEAIHGGEKILVRVLRGARHAHDDEASDEEGDGHSVSTLGVHGADEEKDDHLWIQSHSYDLDDVEILKTHRNTVEAKLGRDSETVVRQIIFVNQTEVHSFCDILKNLRKLQEERAQRQLEDFHIQGTGGPITGRDIEAASGVINLLVEVVSGIQLPVADVNSTDPYVVVHLAKQEVHRTKRIDRNVNPIWTINTGSLFLLTTSPETFFKSSSGLTFTAKDYDSTSQDEVLGKVIVPQEELMKGKGERKEFTLVVDEEHKQRKTPKLVLRYRVATEHDIEFMKVLRSSQKSKKMGVYTRETIVAPRSSSASFVKRESRKKRGGEKEFRVKPGPDPDRVNETEWMTETELDTEAYKTSKAWIEAGSGKLGRLYLELIGCDGLPNLDTGPLQGKTDSFACVIYEDCVVNSEVINDTLSPRWMPWSQRAFVFHIMHLSSQVNLALFDFDSAAPVSQHDPIGRATIDITNFRPMTDYVLQYELYTSALVAKRKSKGSVTVRLRLELKDARKSLVSSILPLPTLYVNVPEKRDFLVTHFTTVGKYDLHKFDMNTLTAYLDELQAYQDVVHLIVQAYLTVLLWRGHFPVTFIVPSIPPVPIDPEQPRSVFRRLTKPVKLRLPLHSMIAFIGGILLAENYNLFPSFLLFAVAWFLLATMGHQHQNPSPWMQRRSYLELWRVLLFNSSASDTIVPSENKEEVEKFIAEKEALKKKREEAAAKKEAKTKEEQADLDKQLAETEEEAIESKKKGFGLPVSLNPLKPILYPLQQQLGMACVGARVATSIVTWQESYYAFLITNACILAGLLLLWVPWSFLIHWTFRIAVWVFLGPWMKLVDIFYMKKKLSEEGQQKDEEERMRTRYKELMEQARWRQTRKEDAKKLKQLKRYMFGKFLVAVPPFKGARHFDCPLFPSHASPHVRSPGDDVKISSRKYGQFLSGGMIPTREMSEEADETTGLLGHGEGILYGTMMG